MSKTYQRLKKVKEKETHVKHQNEIDDAFELLK